MAGRTRTAWARTQTPPPRPHNITYFCGIAQGDFIDAQNPGSGRLAGAINRGYNLGAGTTGHERIKENQVVFNDFLPHLNSVPPAPAVRLGADRDTGSYPSPLQITVTVDPPERTVEATANRITKAFLAGIVTDKVRDPARTLGDGQALTIPSSGMWRLTLSVDGAADDLTRTYWVDVAALVTTIETDNTEPFPHSLIVVASTNEPTATIYHSLDGTLWNAGATVTIDEDATVWFVAITPAGLASDTVSRSFRRTVVEAVTASANDHFLAGRINTTEYLRYSAQFGFFTPFALYHVDGDWLPAPDRALLAALPPALAGPAASGELAAEPAHHDGRNGGRPAITVRKGDPQPGRHQGSLTVILQTAPDSDAPVHYSRDGSIPTHSSPSFSGQASFDIPEQGNHLITCATTGADGTWTYHSFCYSTAP